MTKNYMTADQLGITDAEREGLIELEQHLRNEICTIEDDRMQMASCIMDFEKRDAIKGALGFSMSFGTAVQKSNDTEKYSCGCVACIGGHLSLRMQGVDINKKLFTTSELLIADKYVFSFRYRELHPLYRLFYPDNAIIDGREWDKIKPVVAADAIANFLTTSDPNWQSLTDIYDVPKAPVGDEDYAMDYL